MVATAPNSALVPDACVAALRASYSAAQPGRWAALLVETEEA